MRLPPVALPCLPPRTPDFWRRRYLVLVGIVAVLVVFPSACSLFGPVLLAFLFPPCFPGFCLLLLVPCFFFLSGGRFAVSCWPLRWFLLAGFPFRSRSMCAGESAGPKALLFFLPFVRGFFACCISFPPAAVGYVTGFCHVVPSALAIGSEVCAGSPRLSLRALNFSGIFLASFLCMAAGCSPLGWH